MTKPFDRPLDLMPVNGQRIQACPDPVIDIDDIDCSSAEPREWAERSGAKKAKTRLVKRKHVRTGMWSMS
jgi:hypothetical protein